MLASKDKNAAIKMADFGLAVELPKDQDKGWFGELQNYIIVLTLLIDCHSRLPVSLCCYMTYSEFAELLHLNLH